MIKNVRFVGNISKGTLTVKVNLLKYQIKIQTQIQIQIQALFLVYQLLNHLEFSILDLMVIEPQH